MQKTGSFLIWFSSVPECGRPRPQRCSKSKRLKNNQRLDKSRCCARGRGALLLWQIGMPENEVFHHRKYLITNECQPIKAYSTRPQGGAELGTQISPEDAKKSLLRFFAVFCAFLRRHALRVGAPRSAFRVPISAAVPGPNKTRHRQVTAQPTQ